MITSGAVLLCELEITRNAQIELAANAHLNGILGLDASNKDYCMKSHHEQSKGPLSLHSCYHQIFVFWEKPWRRPSAQKFGELPDDPDDS